MAQSTMALSFNDLASAVGRFLGYGADSGEWEVVELAEIDECIQSGVRRFYNPMPLPGESRSHQWGFLRPKYSFNTVANDFDTDMPDDFMQIVEGIAFDNSESRYDPITIVDAARIMEQKAINDTAGTPCWAAIRAKSQTAGSAQGFELLLYPKPDAIYTLHFRYVVYPNKLSTTNLYPYGGAWHSETVLESCLAVAEERHDDEQRVHTTRYIERLAASVSMDRMNGPLTFGYNGDGRSVSAPEQVYTATYGGVVWD